MMKNYCKLNNCTINDYTTALLSNTMYEYFEKNDTIDGKTYAIPDSIDIGMPVSLRQPFKKLEDVRMVNDFCAFGTSIPIRKTMDEALPILKKHFTALRKSLDVYGMLEVFSISVNLPFMMPRMKSP